MTPRKETGDRGDAAARLVSVSHEYGDGRPALRAVDLTASRGRVLGVMGPNGSGKSTLLRVVAGVLEPGSGRVERFPAGAGTSGSPLRRTAAVFDRSPFADSLAGRENVAALLGLRGRPRRAAERRAGEWLARFGLEGRMDDPVATYSRGMRRKTDLAAALAAEADLLLLDEPLDGLDAAARSTLSRSLAEHASGGGAAVVSGHSAAFMERVCDRVAFLRSGAVVERGRPEELIAAVGADTTVEVELTGPAAGGAAGDGGDWPRGLRLVGRSGRTLRFSARRGGSALPDLCGELLDRGAEISGVRVRRPDLDDAFLALAGEPLRGEG